MATKQLLFETL